MSFNDVALEIIGNRREQIAQASGGKGPAGSATIYKWRCELSRFGGAELIP